MSPERSEGEALARLIWPDAPPERILPCRHCAARNKVEVPTAVFSPEQVECGACREPLFLARDEPLTRLASSAYEHSLDRKALQALKQVPGFGAAVRWVIEKLSERQLRVWLLSAAVRCDEEQFPELTALQDRAARALDLPYRPELFLLENPHMNAMTLGVKNALVIVHSSLLDQLDDREVMAVLGHELGHLHSDHILYKTLAHLLLGLAAPIVGIPQIMSLPLRLALRWWDRCAELTSDRAGLLATRDLAAALSVDFKLAGGSRPGTTSRTTLSLAAFIRQARELQQLEVESWYDGLLADMMALGATHPFAAWRVMHLLRWVESGNYLNILAGDYARVVRVAAPV